MLAYYTGGPWNNVLQLCLKYSLLYHSAGEVGRYIFRVAAGRQGINYDQKCYNWFANEMTSISTIRNYWSQTMVCPCDMRLAMLDGRWTFDWGQFYETNLERRCIYERMPWGQSTQVPCWALSPHH